MLSLHVHFDAARSKFCGSGPFTAAVFAAPQPHSFRTEKFSSTFPALATTAILGGGGAMIIRIGASPLVSVLSFYQWPWSHA